MPQLPTPLNAANKWLNNTRGKWDALKEAVANIPEERNPMKLATTPEAQTRWWNNLEAAKSKWASRTGAVTLTSWKSKFQPDAMKTRWTSAIDAAHPEVSLFYTKLFPEIERILTEIPGRSADIEENITRSAEFIRKMAQWKKPAGI